MEFVVHVQQVLAQLPHLVRAELHALGETLSGMMPLMRSIT
jgi:hypothetical protein